MVQKQCGATGFPAAAGVSFLLDGTAPEPSTLTARITGEIDHHAARRLREEIDGEVFRTLPSVLTLDLSGVGFMDSAGLGLILGRLNLMTSRKGVLRLSGLRPPIARILSLAGVERLPGLIMPGRGDEKPIETPAAVN